MALSFFFLAIPDIDHITIWLDCKTLQWTSSVQTKYGRIGHFPEPLFFWLILASADYIINLEPFFIPLIPDNPVLFNTGKDINKLKTSYFFPASQDPDFWCRISSPIPNDLPGLTPITKNIAAENISKKWIKHEYFLFFQPLANP